MGHPFRFGVQTSSATSGKEWRELARRVEDLGYSTLFVPDHFGDQWAPIVAMTVAAEATEQLKVGSLVLDNDYRHPVVLAKEIATLDLASDGRVEFGIGAGWMTSDYEQSGITLDAPGARIDRMVESLTIMKSLWATGRADFDGDHYQVAGALGSPRPKSTPHPRVIIGGGGRRVLSVAAREADIVGINPSLSSGAVGPEVAKSAVASRFAERVGWVRDAAGARFDEIELQMLTFLVQFTDDRESVAATIGGAFGLSIEESLEVPITLVGTVEQICDQLVRNRDTYGFTYVVVHEGEMDEFAEVVNRLAGT